MTPEATLRREPARRRAGLLAVALFVLGSATAPAIDAWRHAGEAAAGDSGMHECVLCRLAGTPTSPTPAPAASVGEGYDQDGLQFAPVEAHVRATRARLTPPTRAPPA